MDKQLVDWIEALIGLSNDVQVNKPRAQGRTKRPSLSVLLGAEIIIM